MANSSFFKDGGADSGTFASLDSKLADAEASKVAAEAAKVAAEQAETDAQTAESQAVAAKDAAELAQAGATGSETNSASSATTAGNHAADAQKLAVNPEDSQYTLSDGTTTGYSALHYNEKAADSAVVAAADAATATTKAGEASASAGTASTDAATATTKAGEASASATAAAASELAAGNSETAAAASETAAGLSETAAAASETAAAASETAAFNSQLSAQTFSLNAQLSKTNAQNAQNAALVSEGNALTSATNAANSATNAAASETAAGNSETAAAASETAAAASETAAAASETAAAASETAAAASETAAALSETAAAASETNAAGSASTATTQAGTATTKAGEATNSASSALSAQSAAEAARDSALSALDSFDDRYLGVKSSAPTVDNDGNTLQQGALYYSSTDTAMKVWDGSQWLNAYASLSGALITTNNLSDLNNAATARTNLGLTSILDLGITDGTNTQVLTTDGSGTFTFADAPSGDLVDDTTPRLGGHLDSNGHDIYFGDNDKAIFGAGSDLQIYHDGSHSYIHEVGTGDLRLLVNDFELQSTYYNQTMMRAVSNGPVSLYYSNFPKLDTTSSGISVSGDITVSGNVDGRDVAADGTKLDGIEASATADQTAAEIRTLVESATDSNVFTDADHTKLNGIETGATADQTKSDIDALGIDAATLDGIDSTSFLRSDANDTTSGTLTVTGGEVLVDKVRCNTGQQLVLNAGEANGVATGQGSELVYMNAEAGVQINSSTDNWVGGWANRRTTTITGTRITVDGNYWEADDDTWNKFYTTHGYIQLGPANTNYAHIYTDRPAFYFNKTNLYASSHIIWHAGNDGSGSGLDADTVDGIQASSFVRSDADDTMTGNLDINKGASTTLSVRGSGTGTAKIWARGSSQATAMVMVSQDDDHGGGIEYNGDNNPVSTGAGADYIALFRVSSGSYNWTARNLYANNDWQFRGNITAYASDERLKENIETIPNALDKVCKLRGVTFDWKDDCEDKGFMPTMQHETGVIAQEVQAVIPDAAVPAPFDEDYLTVKHEKIIPVLIEAIKELKAEIEVLKKG